MEVVRMELVGGGSGRSDGSNDDGGGEIDIGGGSWGCDSVVVVVLEIDGEWWRWGVFLQWR